MTRALLYQPKRNWRTAMALAAALLIHFAAIAFAATHQATPVETPTGGSDYPPLDLTLTPPSEEPTPPPDLPESPPNLPSTDESMFRDEGPTPPPIQPRRTRTTMPIARANHSATSGSLSLSQARVNALSAPRPEYPYEARRQKVTGSGVAAITVDPVTGTVTSVVMVGSTGSLILDNAAVAAFRRWRFQPGTVMKVRLPVTFTLTGAQD